MSMLDRIVSDPKICRGMVCIKGTRIPVTVILDNLAVGLTPDEILHEYPTLKRDDIRAALEYASQLASEQWLPLPKAS